MCQNNSDEMWKGKFSAKPLSIGPKGEKRKLDDEDEEQRKERAEAAKRQTKDKQTIQLMLSDNAIENTFDKTDNAQFAALQSLDRYRFDAYRKLVSERPDFQSVYGFFFETKYDASQIFQRFLDVAQGVGNSGNTDFEAFFALLSRKPVEVLKLRNVPIESFMGDLMYLVLAQFEATNELKELILHLNDTALDDAFADLIVKQRVDEFFRLLSLQKERFSSEMIDMKPADIEQQRILSFLTGNDFVNYCKTTKKLQNICESGVWKNAIADIRFERQFGKRAEEVLALRPRFYPGNVSLRAFQYAAIRAEKYLNDLQSGKFVIFVSDSAKPQKASPLNAADNFSATSLAYLLEKYDSRKRSGVKDGDLTDFDLEIPVVLHLLDPLDPLSALKAFTSLIPRLNSASQSLLFDADGKVYDGTPFVEKLRLIENSQELLTLVESIEYGTLKRIVEMQIGDEMQIEDEIWTTIALLFAAEVEVTGKSEQYFLIVSKWLTSKRGKDHAEYVRVRDQFVLLVLHDSNLERIKNFYDESADPELWNSCVSAALDTYAAQNIPEGYVNIIPWPIVFLALKLRAAGKLAANLEVPVREFVVQAHVADLSRHTEDYESWGLVFVPSEFFQIDSSPEIWLPLPSLLTNASSGVEDPSVIGLASAWFALQLLKSGSNLVNAERANLERIAKTNLPAVARYIGEQWDWITANLLEMIRADDDRGTWLATLRILYDRIFDVERKPQFRLKELPRVARRFYLLAKKMDELGFLTQEHRRFVALFIMTKPALFRAINDGGKWEKSVLGLAL